MSQNLYGSLFMTLSMFGFTSSDALIKHSGAWLPLSQILFFRGIVAVLLLTIIALIRKELFVSIKNSQRRFLFLRVLGEVGATLFFFTALLNMKISNAVAILQCLPLALAFFGALLFGRLGYVHKENEWNQFEDVLSELDKYINSGKDMFRLMQEVVLPKELSVGEGYGTVEWAIRSIYEGYTGWFRHNSTTELYSYSPINIFPDLNDLIDKESALKRIKELIDKKEYLKAINISEIIISSDDNKEALKMYLNIHQILLKEAQKNSNRWIIKWLEFEIEETKNKLNE